MTDTSATALRILSFGSADGGIWAAAVDGGTPAVIWGDGPAAGEAATLEAQGWVEDGRAWRLGGDGVELRAEPQGTEPEPGEAPGPVSGLQELCRVRGTVRVDGAERAVDCIGARTLLEGVDLPALDSVRGVSGWVAEGEAFTLLSLRPARSAGQQSDRIVATLFDPDGWLSVGDPRLSTTYDGSGRPTRITVELWVGEGDKEFPRRAAGEAAGPGATVAAGGGELRAVPLRCHSRGHEGAGVYSLLRF